MPLHYAGALKLIAGGRLGSEVAGGIKSNILCCFIRSESVNTAIKCTMNIRPTVQISIGRHYAYNLDMCIPSSYFYQATYTHTVAALMNT